MAAKVWGAGSAAGADGLWSTAANWTGDTVPVTVDTVTFNNTAGSPNCTVDNIGTFTGAITLASTYAGAVTQNVAIVGDSTYVQAGGTWNQAAAFTRRSMNISGGSWLGGSQAMNFFETTTLVTISGGHVRMTSGTCTVSVGSWSQSGSPTFDANGGTVLFNGNLNVNASITHPVGGFNLVVFGKTAGRYTVAAGTTVPLGTNPSVGGDATLTVVTLNGALTWTGRLTMGGGFSASATASATVSGTPAITMTHGSFSVDAAAVPNFTAGIALTCNGTLNIAQTITAVGYVFGTCVISRSNTSTFTVAAGTTLPLGANPTASTTGATTTINGSLSWTGTLTYTATNFVLGATAVISGNCVIKPSATFTGTAGASCVGLIINHDFSNATGKTLAGGGVVYGGFLRTGSGTGTTTITGTNTFSVFTDDLGLVAHSITFPNVTTTVGLFNVRGSAGKLVTLARTGGSGVFTLAKNTSGPVDSVAYISVSNSTVDASPLWYAGLTPPSVDGGGNTNWIFGVAPGRQKQFTLL